MTKEEITEAEAKAEVEKAEAEAVNANPEGGEAQQDPSKIDYEAELALAQQKQKEAEKAAAELAFKLREKRRAEEQEIEEEVEKPLTTQDLVDLEERILQRNEKLSQETRALEIARANTSSEAEAQLALLKWKDVKSSGDLEKDILFAIGGINYKKVISVNSELKRALNSKENISNDSVSTYHDAMPKSEPKLPENSPLKEWKYAGNGIYTKKLSSGKIMFKNTRAMPGQPKMWTE